MCSIRRRKLRSLRNQSEQFPARGSKEREKTRACMGHYIVVYESRGLQARYVNDTKAIYSSMYKPIQVRET